jgi:UDP-N-acetylglucosamine:LPS N-acetylglucosamine transferase
MKRVLLMPFLHIPTGHHHVADTIINELQDFPCQTKKIDIFSYRSNVLESISTFIYLKWIQSFPKSYSFVYRRMACQKTQNRKNYKLYEMFYLQAMKDIIEHHAPHIVFCTHALPSYMLNKMKHQYPSMKIVNVYTDYFVNEIWGIHKIDFHLAPCMEVKKDLISLGVQEEKIYVTGIPIHRTYFHKSVSSPSFYHRVLIMGGTLGVGNIKKFIQHLKPKGRIKYFVLCGRNQALYKYILNLHNPYITPLPFIREKSAMNDLYTSVSAVITKPGGVTLSECIEKRVPIFVFDTLPGQEEINFQKLKKEGIVVPLTNWNMIDVENELLKFLNNEMVLKQYQEKLNEFQSSRSHNLKDFLDMVMNGC